jgi:hypothetical protein
MNVPRVKRKSEGTRRRVFEAAKQKYALQGLYGPRVAQVRRDSAAKLAPYTYTSIIWATLFGFLVWGETLGLVPVIGIAAIVGSSIAVAVRNEPPEGPAV